MKRWRLLLAGLCAGAINGLLGAGGGMLLVPLLSGQVDEDQLFPSSVTVMAAICAVSAAIGLYTTDISFSQALPYLAGSALGAFPAWYLSKKFPTKWLHRILGAMILWGGIRYLC